MAHHNIFRDELAITYPSYGIALWKPSPGGQYDAVEVGDVGFVHEGYFQRLFNVLHPRNHSSHRNLSLVPEDHEQLRLIHDHIVRDEIRAGSVQNTNHLCSRNVTFNSRGLGTLASRPEDDSRVSFSCYGKQGALLSLPVSAQSEDTSARAKFGNWMVTHIDTWFAFTQSLGLGVEKMEDMVLVTGRHLTKSWVNVAFNQRRPDAGVSFNAYVSGDSEIHLERQYVHGGELKLGPTGKDLREDQCIFIRGFRVARLLGIWPRLRGQAGPSPDTSGHEPEPPSGLELLSAPADANDPLHVILQYIAEQAPQCDFALVHDDDLTYIGGNVYPNELKGYLWSSLPKVQQSQCELLPGNTSGSGVNVAIAQIATLSQHNFKEPLGRPPPPQGSSTAAGLSSGTSSSLNHPPTHGSFGPSSGLTGSIRDLNDYLQKINKSENLVPYLGFASVQHGPNNQAIHIGTYTFRGRVVGTGRGTTISGAKRLAATQALQYFRTNGVPE